MDNSAVRTIGAADFRAHCLQVLDELKPEGIVITKRGKPVAELKPFPRNHGHFIGIAAGQVGAAPGDDLFSTGAWVSDEWGDLHSPPLPGESRTNQAGIK
jgi:antitoxin (DNA-binding transcriptional repressor) of toxin-antitoxin stability system